ncbi:MAG: sigma-70 family RNA polymerase sigma factor [Acidobacteria bacterium]|nr:sigma-70 family RNA polymerase sigma factor [Acidobacteriota bacterium]
MRWSFRAGDSKAEAPAGPQEARAEERRLIERAQRGDHEAFRALVERHQRRVFSLIANVVRRPADVEDIAQQVFLKVYLALPRFDFRAAFSTWLYRIAVNECYDDLRRRRAQKAPGEAEVPVAEPAEWERLLSGGGAGEPDPGRRAEARQLVERLFARLPAEDRLLLSLKELEGFSIEEIAALRGLKENTVKVRLFRARRRLVEIERRFLSARRAKR